MVGRLRKLTRSMGFDIARYPGAAAQWPRLTELLDRHSVTLVLDVGANIGQYAVGLRNNGYDKRIVSFDAVEAGRAAYKAGRIPKRDYAEPSSPQLGLIGS